MLKRTMLFTTLLVVTLCAFAQDITIKGRIFERGSNKPLSGVRLQINTIGREVVSNQDGSYILYVPSPGKYSIIVTSVNHNTIEKEITISRNGAIADFYLSKYIQQLDNLEVTAKRKIYKPVTNTIAQLNVPIKDIPISLSQLSYEFLDQLQVKDINDAVKYISGVHGTSNYGGFQTFKYRGLGRPVVMVDGALDYRMVFANSAPLTSLASVERVEYLKGPASVNYGNSVDGGILNIVRKQPTDYFTINTSAYYGSWNNKGTTIGLGGRVTDKINYRFDVGLSSTDGWRDMAQKYSNVYGAIDFFIDDKNKVELRLGAHDDFYATETGFPAFRTTIYNVNDGKEIYHQGDLIKEYNRKQRYNDPGDFLKNKNINGALNYIHHFSNISKLTFRNSYTYDYIDYFSTEELTFPTSEKDIYPHYIMQNGVKKYVDLSHVQRSFPFRFGHLTKTLQSSIDYNTILNTGEIKHNLLLGYSLIYLDRISYRTSTKTDIQGAGKFATIAVVNPVLNQGDLTEKFSSAIMYQEIVNGLYIHDLVEFNQNLKALLALRVDNYDMKYWTGDVKVGKEVSNEGEKSKQNTTSLSYRLGLVYQPIQDLSIYTSFSNFFRPNRRAYGTDAIYLDDKGKEFDPSFFKPEKGFQIEGGVHYDLASRLTVSGSIFLIRKNNMVEYVEQSPTGKPIYAQIGQAESKGFELDLTYKPFRGMSITTGYTMCHAKYTKFTIEKYTADKDGNYLHRNPKSQFYLWSYYEVPEGFLKNFNVGFGANYTDEMYTSPSNDYKLPAFWLAELTLGYKFNNTYFSFKVNNLFDTKYFSNSVMDNQYVAGAERNFLFTVGYKF